MRFGTLYVDMAEPVQKCVIVGGGLAGLVAARNLARQGWKVTVLEKTDTPGGKARADARPEAPVLIEHGYHVFPKWYTNTRALLDEIEQERSPGWGANAEGRFEKRTFRFVDLDGYYYLTPDGEFHRMYSPVRTGETWWETARLTAQSMKANIFDTLKPWHVQYLFLLSVIDILRKPFTNRMMDSVSQVGFLRAKPYATESLAKLNQENMLKASAIPAYEMSAMTAYHIGGYWVRQPDPFLSVLPGDLQTCFIEPIVKSCERHGVDLQLGKEVVEISIGNSNGKPFVERLLDRSGQDVCPRLDDQTMCIVTTPPEVTRKFISEDVYRADPELGNMEHLETEPMSALHLFTDLSAAELNLKGKKEHVFLAGSHYGLSFIDNNQAWDKEHRAQNGWTYLSFISSNFSPLREVRGDEARMQLLLEEIQEYLPELKRDRIRAWYMNDNLQVPLYINTVGSWRNRPRVDSAIPNLFFAGDYVKNPIDLACMEGAVYTAMQAAHEICETAPIPVAPIRYPEWLMNLSYFGASVFPGTWLAVWLARHYDRSGRAERDERLSSVKIAAAQRRRGKDWMGPLRSRRESSSEGGQPTNGRSREPSGAFRTMARDRRGGSKQETG